MHLLFLAEYAKTLNESPKIHCGSARFARGLNPIHSTKNES